MKFTEKEFKDFIINEAKKLIDNEENFSFETKEDNLNNNCGCEDNLTIEPNNSNDFDKLENYEEVNPEEFQEEVEEAKNLSEELTRMKQLLSFNNPLLKL